MRLIGKHDEFVVTVHFARRAAMTLDARGRGTWFEASTRAMSFPAPCRRIRVIVDDQAEDWSEGW